ncbi:alpha/beta fold hydrolase [Alkalicoccus daliensis]|uniref:Pimeloyl-ACP methyl ester carboxylesterase n=1 Tax=Alkalicoccus daliensis TaxID=745820 RepID=A0A1H0E2W6_9BACI|nr:alpha/beta hydrolase [Alkalicoccus daliensis]SDN76730.1 Pimeloyl-ACP methyl ester carboxylesterase [Alkalicoccus daliensis]
MPYFTSINTQIHYKSTGSGTPIIFVPPPALGAEAFQYQFSQLADHFQVITFDPAGNGKSGKENIQEQSIREWSDDILALADHLSLEKILLCGYSLGGSPVQEFAAAHPDRAAGIILLASFPEVRTKLLAAKIKTGEAVTAMNFKRFLAAGLAVAHSSNKKVRKNLQRNIEQSSFSVVKNIYRNGRHYSIMNKISSIECPVAFIYGAWDPVARPYADLYRQKLPQLQLIKISNASHQLTTRAAPQVNAIIRSLYQ